MHTHVAHVRNQPPSTPRFKPLSVVPPENVQFDPDLADREIAVRADRDPFRIAFVGTLVPRKGLYVLLDGLARVSGAGTGDAGEATPGDGSEQTPDDWHLSVVGREADPAYAHRARERARELGSRGSGPVRAPPRLGRVDGAGPTFPP